MASSSSAAAPPAPVIPALVNDLYPCIFAFLPVKELLGIARGCKLWHKLLHRLPSLGAISLKPRENTRLGAQYLFPVLPPPSSPLRQHVSQLEVQSVHDQFASACLPFTVAARLPQLHALTFFFYDAEPVKWLQSLQPSEVQDRSWAVWPATLRSLKMHWQTNGQCEVTHIGAMLQFAAMLQSLERLELTGLQLWIGGAHEGETPILQGLRKINRLVSLTIQFTDNGWDTPPVSCFPQQDWQAICCSSDQLSELSLQDGQLTTEFLDYLLLAKETAGLRSRITRLVTHAGMRSQQPQRVKMLELARVCPLLAPLPAEWSWFRQVDAQQ